MPPLSTPALSASSLSAPHWERPPLRACLPGPPRTGRPPTRQRCHGKQPPAPLEKLPGSRRGFPTEDRELGALIILESASGVRGVSPSRSGVLASELAEVRVGLARGVVPLGKKPEMGRTILLTGQGRPVLGESHFYGAGGPRPPAHSLWRAPCQGSRDVFSTPSGPPGPPVQSGQAGHTVGPQMTCRDGLSPRSLLCTGAQAPRADTPPSPFPPTAQLWSRHPVGGDSPTLRPAGWEGP